MKTHIGQYEFIIDNDRDIKVKYPNGKIIDLNKINIINVGLMPQEGEYTVTLFTSESFIKMRKGITENIELVGFHFENFGAAILCHNLLSMHLFKPDINESQEIIGKCDEDNK
jgi:hypothetical protein